MWEQLRYGLEPGGIHHRIFWELEATPSVIPLVRFIWEKPIRLTFGVTGEQWQRQQQQFPVNRFGSCWQLVPSQLGVSGRDPVLPPAVCGTCGF